MARTRKNLRRGGQPAPDDPMAGPPRRLTRRLNLAAENTEQSFSGTKRPRQQEAPAEESLSKRGRLACPTDIMRYHLKADVLHDADTGSFTGDNAEMATLYGVGDYDDRATTEDKVVEFIKDPRYDFNIPDKQYRLGNTISFQYSKKTSSFPSGSMFKPFDDVDNSNVAVLQDAGEQLFSIIGAKNLITFGSVLDQAKKPVSKEDQPVYYNTSESITFEPCVYGFNPAAVGNIRISNFNGKQAKCEFKYTYGNKSYDGGTIDNTGSYFNLNMNRLGGDFKSNDEIKKIDNNTNKKFAGYIGKALGDITLVASITPKIGNTTNQFYPGNKPLTLLHENTRVPEISHFLLNTGDRLNHMRAFMFGIGSVYSPPGKNGVRKFEYIPGIEQIAKNLEETREMYLKRIKDLIVQIDNRYGELINHIINDKEDIISKITTDPLKIPRATAMIKYLVNIVETFRTYVLFYFMIFYEYYNSIKANVMTNEQLTGLKNTYEILLDKSRGLMPSHVSTFNANGSTSSKITILMTDVLYFSEYTIVQNTLEEINFEGHYNRVFGIEEGPAVSATIPKEKVDSWITNINRGRVKYTIPSGFPINTSNSGAITQSHSFYPSIIYQLIQKGRPISSPYDSLFNIFNFTDSDKSFLNSGGGGLVGGQEKDKDSIEVFAQPFTIPTKAITPLKDLKIPEKEEDTGTYYSDVLGDFLDSGRSINDLIGAVQTYNMNEFSTIDEILLKTLYKDYKIAIGIVPDDKEPTLPELKEEGGKEKDIHTKESLLFNSFACKYNAQIVEASRNALCPDTSKKYKSDFSKLKTEKDELEELFKTYAVQFEALANAPQVVLAPMKVEEQVSESLGKKSNIDPTKSGVFPHSISQAETVLLDSVHSSRSSSQARSVNLSQAETASLNTSYMDFGSQSSSPVKDYFSHQESPPASRLSSPHYSKNNNPRRQSFYDPTTPIGSQTPEYNIMNAGQRVPAENPLIDLTKSFVRRGGSSPNSEVK